MKQRLFILPIACLFSVVNASFAHPVARDHHDRTIVVSAAVDRDGRTTIRVDYRLEVDEFTVILDDMRPYKDEVDIKHFRDKPLEYYDHFTRIYAPILARNLVAKVNGKEARFTCIKRGQRLRDEKDEPLGHLRCDFVFQATIDSDPAKESHFTFQETNYAEQSGKVDLSLGTLEGIKIRTKMAPDAALKNRPAIELKPGDEQKLRTLEMRFTVAPGEKLQGGGPSPRSDADSDRFDLLDLFRRGDLGLVLLLGMAALFGAAHALTPGHGKTLVAAYLVGERGTVRHAVVLGLVTTLTHTGIVLIIAIVLFFLPETAGGRQWVQEGLGLVMGLTVVAFGAWLFLQRLAGRADHLHLGGGHHHHHHSHAGHHHDPGHSIAASTSESGIAAQRPRWGGLIVLGMTGGIVPCWDAIVLLLITVGTSEFWLALPLLLAFSAGLAGVLVLLGVLVVQARGFLGDKWGEGRVIRSLPIVSALVITAMGMWLCYESVHR